MRLNRNACPCHTRFSFGAKSIKFKSDTELKANTLKLPVLINDNDEVLVYYNRLSVIILLT